MLALLLCLAEGLQQLDDGGGGADAVGDGGSVDVESRQVVHGIDDVVDIGASDEACARGHHACGKSLFVMGIGLVVAEIGVGSGKTEGGGEVGGVA